jgi:hypothetical protein
VKSIARFIDNQFALSGLQVLEEYKGKRFHQLPPREQRFLRDEQRYRGLLCRQPQFIFDRAAGKEVRAQKGSEVA